MAEGLSLLNRISARVSARVLTPLGPDHWAVATLVSPLYAVTTSDAVPPDFGAEVVLRSTYYWAREVPATVVGRDAERNFVLLRLATAPTEAPADLLAPVESPIGSMWESFSPAHDNADGIYSSGTVGPSARPTTTFWLSSTSSQRKTMRMVSDGAS